MTIEDWITKDQFNRIKGAISRKEIFNHRKEIDKFDFHMYSDIIAKDLADDVWHGDRYLIHFSWSKHRGDWHGWGWAEREEEYKNKFKSFETFAKFFDSNMKKEFKNYEPYEAIDVQLSLFD